MIYSVGSIDEGKIGLIFVSNIMYYFQPEHTFFSPLLSRTGENSVSPDFCVEKVRLTSTGAGFWVLSVGVVDDRGKLNLRLTARTVICLLNALSTVGFSLSCPVMGRSLSVTSPVVSSTDAKALPVRVASCPDDLSIGSRQYPVVREWHRLTTIT